MHVLLSREGSRIDSDAAKVESDGARPSEHALTDLTAAALTRRLKELAGEERAVLAEFLVHLEEFDRRRSYLDAGHGSLWVWCLRVLHLREGAAGRRIGAMRIVRRFPKIVDTIRDGRLSLSTAVLLGQVLTDDNFDELVTQAAFKTKAEVDHLVASLRPREVPKDGIRLLPPAAPRLCAAPPAAASLLPSPTPGLPSPVRPLPESTAGHGSAVFSKLQIPELERPRVDGRPADEAEVRPVSRDRWSVRVTIDGACKADLEMLQHLLSHKCGRGLASVLQEAIRCGIEKHGKRRAAVRTRRRNARPADGKGAAGLRTLPAPEADHVSSVDRALPLETTADRTGSSRDPLPADVKQAVYDRDGGCCSFVAEDGQRCGSKWKLEFDHVLSEFLGGPPTVDNVRLACRAHNVHHAEQVFGREHMDKFRRSARVAGGGQTGGGQTGGDHAGVGQS